MYQHGAFILKRGNALQFILLTLPPFIQYAKRNWQARSANGRRSNIARISLVNRKAGIVAGSLNKVL